MELILYAEWKGYAKTGGTLNVSKYVYRSLFGDEQKQQPACNAEGKKGRKKKKERREDGKKEMRKKY